MKNPKPMKGRTSTRDDGKKPMPHAKSPSGQGIYGNKPPKKGK